MQHSLIPPYGGTLLPLLADAERAAAIRAEARELSSLDLDWRQICQLELLLTGALSPLTGYMGRAEMSAVLSGLRLVDGRFWPLPVMLAVPEQAARGLSPGQTVCLRDGEGFMPALLHVSEIWPVDHALEERLAAASGLPPAAPAGRSGEVYVAGRVEGVALPPRHDFLALRPTPAELRGEFQRRGWRRVLAYQPGQPMHRPQREFVLNAALRYEANLLIHVMAGADPVSDASHFALVRACRAIMPRFPAASSALALNPMVPDAAGARETWLRAIIARNYGCSHLVVGGEAPPAGEFRRGEDLAGARVAPPEGFLAELGVTLIDYPRLVYLEDADEFVPAAEAPADARAQAMNGGELTRRLMTGSRIPAWFADAEVLDELRKAFPPRTRQGFTVFFTGLSGAGKSTLARALTVKLMEMDGRRVTLLDGDVVRRHLSSELGFSKAHRDINIRRIGYVASEITKHGGIAICAPIAPYAATRRAVRDMIEPWGGFIEIHVATSIDVCESRDRKGLYAKARAGLIAEFTGVSDPYEVPEKPELAIDTALCGVDEAVQSIVLKLEHEGFLR
ncbi:MAG: bifunctional sulfate adenylyltransferase/adenylylsulfate kinase [Betaproteobacteria bacterium]|nr:bifunctional sulfate adenylyltransferase/adenylylsulfate kinase [Betaproteobacteria bacterium]